MNTRAGKKHANVDCISRYPTETPDETIDEFPLYLIEALDIINEQNRDEWCRGLKADITNDKQRVVDNYKSKTEFYTEFRIRLLGDEVLLLCVPKNLRRKILEELHSDVTAGHLGVLKTMLKVRERFYWNKIEKSIRKFVQNCTSCRKTNMKLLSKRGNLQPHEYPTVPFMTVGMDLFGSLTETPRKNKYVILLIDFYSKYIEAEPLKNKRSSTIADWFVNKIVLRHGAIERVLTDQGLNFCSKFMDSVFELTKAQHIRTAPYHPETNGLAERAIRTVRQMMTHFVNEQHNNWDLYLNKLVFAYNSAKQRTTMETPFKMLYGREPTLPIDVTYKLRNRFKFGDNYQQAMEECQQLVRIRVSDAQMAQKHYFNKKHRDVKFNLNDLVALRVYTRAVGKTEKLFKNLMGLTDYPSEGGR